MEPVAVQPDGSGRFTLRYVQTSAPMQAVSEVGPFFWVVGEEHHSLLASSETEFLWHKLTVKGKPQATIRFMKCTFRQ